MGKTFTAEAEKQIARQRRAANKQRRKSVALEKHAETFAARRANRLDPFVELVHKNRKIVEKLGALSKAGAITSEQNTPVSDNYCPKGYIRTSLTMLSPLILVDESLSNGALTVARAGTSMVSGPNYRTGKSASRVRSHLSFFAFSNRNGYPGSQIGEDGEIPEGCPRIGPPLNSYVIDFPCHPYNQPELPNMRADYAIGDEILTTANDLTNDRRISPISAFKRGVNLVKTRHHLESLERNVDIVWLAALGNTTFHDHLEQAGHAKGRP